MLGFVLLERCFTSAIWVSWADKLMVERYPVLIDEPKGLIQFYRRVVLLRDTLRASPAVVFGPDIERIGTQVPITLHSLIFAPHR